MEISYNPTFSITNNGYDSTTNVSTNFNSDSLNVDINGGVSYISENHNDLYNRNAANQHTIGSITGLEDRLEEIESGILEGNFASSATPGGSALSAEKVLHKLTIGDKTFDGSADVTVDVYDGEMSGEYVTVNNQLLFMNSTSTTSNSVESIEQMGFSSENLQMQTNVAEEQMGVNT